MKFGLMGGVAGAVTVWCAVTSATAVDSSGTPYQGIVDRNVFGLRPPPPPPSPEANKPPAPKITLQGITTILGKKIVLMKVTVPATKPGAKVEEVPLTLAVGQKSEGVEVLEINELEGMVKVNDYDTITNLTFKENGVNLANAAPVPGVQQPGVPRPAAAPAGGNPGYPTSGYTAPGGYQRRVPRVPGVNPAGGAAYNGAPPTAGAYSGGYSAPPVAAVSTTPTTTTSPGTVALNGLGAPASPVQQSRNWPPETPMTPEQATIMEALYNTKYAQQIEAGTMPAIPGSNPLTDGANTAANASGQRRPAPQ